MNLLTVSTSPVVNHFPISSVDKRTSQPQPGNMCVKSAVGAFTTLVSWSDLIDLRNTNSAGYYPFTIAHSKDNDPMLFLGFEYVMWPPPHGSIKKAYDIYAVFLKQETKVCWCAVHGRVAGLTSSSTSAEKNYWEAQARTNFKNFFRSIKL